MIRKDFIIFLLLAVGFISCEENFSPKAEFEEEYILTCIIGASSPYERISPSVNIFHTYDVEDFNPSVNTVDPMLSGAEVTLEYSNGNSFFLEEDTLIYSIEDTVTGEDIILWEDLNRYGNPRIVYSGNGLPYHRNQMNLTATLSNGKVLSANTKIPKGIFFNYSYDFPHGVTPTIEQWKYGNYWGIYWDPVDFHLCFSKFVINYTKQVDSATTSSFYEEIPLQLIDNNGNQEPVYPSFTRKGKLEYKFDAMNYALRRISEGDPDKENYKIYWFSLIVVEYDTPLSNYYSSINGYLDQFSVRLDETIYSNIRGGMGIFGTYKLNEMDYLIDEDYVHSFGYKMFNEP